MKCILIDKDLNENHYDLLIDDFEHIEDPVVMALSTYKYLIIEIEELRNELYTGPWC